MESRCKERRGRQGDQLGEPCGCPGDGQHLNRETDKSKQRRGWTGTRFVFSGSNLLSLMDQRRKERGHLLAWMMKYLMSMQEEKNGVVGLVLDLLSVRPS